MDSKLNWGKATKIKHFPICFLSSFRKSFFEQFCFLCTEHVWFVKRITLLFSWWSLPCFVYTQVWALSAKNIFHAFWFLWAGFPTITRICKRNFSGDSDLSFLLLFMFKHEVFSIEPFIDSYSHLKERIESITFTATHICIFVIFIFIHNLDLSRLVM